MPSTSELIAIHGKTAQLSPLTGRPTGLRAAIVRTVEPNGTVSIEMRTGRAGIIEAAIPSWYEPARGDVVLVAHLNGNLASPIIVGPHTGKVS